MGEKYLKTKEGSIEDVVKNLQNKVLETDYKDNFKKELDKAGKPLGHMTGMEKKEFYNKVDSVQETIRIRPKNTLGEARWRVSGQMGYKGIGGTDGFEMVINASSEQDAIRRAEKELDKARRKRNIGPGGGGNLEDVDIEGAERTNDPLESPSSNMLHHNDPQDGKTKPLEEKDGANTSTRTGSASRGAKKKYRFGYRVAEKDPSVKEGFFDTKTFAQMAEDLKDVKKKKSPDKVAKVEPGSSKDSKDSPKDADALEKQLVVAQGQINLLKQKIENEKNKIVKPKPNKETGEVPLTIGVAYKHMKDKEKKEGDKTAAPSRDVKESKVKENTAKKQNASQRSKGGEKSIISHMVNKSIKEITANDNKTFAQIAAEIREGKGPKGPKNAPDGESDKKKEQESDTDTRDPKKKTMSGKIATSPEMNPRVDYKY